MSALKSAPVGNKANIWESAEREQLSRENQAEFCDMPVKIHIKTDGIQ